MPVRQPEQKALEFVETGGRMRCGRRKAEWAAERVMAPGRAKAAAGCATQYAALFVVAAAMPMTTAMAVGFSAMLRVFVVVAMPMAVAMLMSRMVIMVIAVAMGVGRMAMMVRIMDVAMGMGVG